ncbi:hypothetical protein SAY87_007968 [Trapa incisa]|uniref:Uncharacterized protein n=1 Tax=Trapa incisa TaxID=236973 RepID=A0AAN7KLD2_9MYRT|nr:hypothetical protein SAY87_007968 [Trapa incisa]
MKITSEDALEPPASRRAIQDGFYPGAIQARAPSSFTITVDCMSFRGFRFLRSFALIVSCNDEDRGDSRSQLLDSIPRGGRRISSEVDIDFSFDWTELLPISFEGLLKAVKKGDTIFVG